MTHRILVIEDQEDNRIILRDLLTSADFEVIEAVNGQEGVDLARAEVPDLILMDIQLPPEPGYTRTLTITQEPGTSAPNRLARVTVTVNWRGSRPQTVTFETMRAELT